MVKVTEIFKILASRIWIFLHKCKLLVEWWFSGGYNNNKKYRIFCLLTKHTNRLVKDGLIWEEKIWLKKE